MSLAAAPMSLFATCPRGLEAALAEELASLGANAIKAVNGGVAYEGDQALLYRSNLHSRLATRVLLRVAQGNYRDDRDIHALAKSVDWPALFGVGHSIRVDVSATRSPLRSLELATLRIKDGLCDRFREHGGQRPDVDTRNPAVRIAGYLDATLATLYLDASGEPLWQRGYRCETGEAPLKENLAAGLVRLSGWNPTSPTEAFIDPMCGSGTIVIEAAMLAAAIAPGLHRSFAFERWHDYTPALWQQLQTAARAQQREPQGLIAASDLLGRELDHARANLEAAGLLPWVTLKQANVLELPPPAESGVMLCNPPYGERLGESDALAAFYPKLGDALKKSWAGWRCYFLTGDPRLPKLIGLKASRRTPLFNGAIDCRLLEFRMVAGSMRGKPPS